MSTIKKLLVRAHDLYPQVPLGDIDLLLAKTLTRSPNYLYKNPEKKLAHSSVSTFWRLLKLRNDNYSVAYLLGKKEFYKINFLVNKHVLIPRPDSEILIDEALKYLKNKNNCQVIDMGTGSGALIITLAKNLKNIHQYWASDISSRAIRVAKTNARKHGLKNYIKFIKSNLLKDIPDIKFDLVIANLPYLNKEQLKEPSIKKEPQQALYGGHNGLHFYQKLLKQLPKYLNKKYLILLEIDPSQKEAIGGVAKKYLAQSNIQFTNDLSGQVRLVKIHN